MQLDLFQHAPRYYHESLRRLGCLDLTGCLHALAQHQKESPLGPDPEPVREAVRWIRGRLPQPGFLAIDHATSVLALCQTLRGGRGSGQSIPTVLSPCAEVTREIVARLARAALQDCSVPLEAPLTAALPWGVFELLAGRGATARLALLPFVRRTPSAAAYLALGEACTLCGRKEEGLGAWRDGFALDFMGGGWSPHPEWICRLRDEYASDPDFHGPWWAVGAYLDGSFPRYSVADPECIQLGWGRFLEMQSTAGVDAPVLFFSGLFLSEQGENIPMKDRVRVRRLLARLHPEGYRRHREQLEEPGAPTFVSRQAHVVR